MVLLLYKIINFLNSLKINDLKLFFQKDFHVEIQEFNKPFLLLGDL